MKNRLALLITMIFTASAFSSSHYIETDIVQIKLNRVYFGSGTEDGLKAGASFVIECGGAKKLTGTLDYAGPGISYSRAMAELEEFNIDPECIARLTTSAIDSAATITLGTDMPLNFFDPEHETLFIRRGDTLLPNLVDSAHAIGNTLALYLSHEIRFSNGTLFNAGALTYCLEDIKSRSQSFPVRYFFSKLLPLDSGGIEIISGYNIQLRFYNPFPRAVYFLSHPDFAVYDRTGNGTGPLTEYQSPEMDPDKKVFIPNRHFRGPSPAFSKMVIEFFEQQYRMKFAYENKKIEGFIGFGYEADLAGLYQARSLYPEVAVLISGIGGELFSQALFPTSLYYCFNPDLSHIFFQYGEIRAINRWLHHSETVRNEERFYPFDFIRGRELQISIKSTRDTAMLIYNDNLLYETTRYMADIIARGGMTAPVNKPTADGRYDVCVTFFPASDNIIPFSLFAAVLELNDQNRLLPPSRQYHKPGWIDTDRGSRLYDIKERNEFFARAEETVVQTGGFFPLFRPYIFAVSRPEIKGLAFDFYGYPVLAGAVKFAGSPDAGSKETGP